MALSKEELNKIALDYHGNDLMQDKHIEDECQFYTYEWVFNQIQVTDKILEMGYGEGNFTEELIRRNLDVTVIDGSDILLEKAKNLYLDKIKCECYLFEDYEPTTRYDIILATHVLEHVDEPVRLLKIMKNWLTNTGKIIIIVPNKESIHRQLAVLMQLQPALDTLGARDYLVGHQRVYSLSTLKKDVELSGMKVETEYGFFLKVLPNSMMLDYSNALIKALNQISPNLPAHLLANIGVIASK